MSVLCLLGGIKVSKFRAIARNAFKSFVDLWMFSGVYIALENWLFIIRQSRYSSSGF